jgi:inner membrane protein
MLIILKRKNKQRAFWWKAGLVMSALYLGYCSINKMQIDRQVRTAFQKQNIPYDRYFTTPAPLQNLLWFVVAGNDSGYYTGFRSLFDKSDTIAFQYFPRNTALLDTVSDHENLQKLIRFSQQYYTVEKWGDTLVFNDLRFGQMIGWQNPRGRFVFHYFLSHPHNNDLIVQRGRFDQWSWQVFRDFLDRIKGK